MQKYLIPTILVALVFSASRPALILNEQICHHAVSLHCERTTGLVGWLEESSASSREGAHGKRVLLVDGVQPIGAHSVNDELKLLRQRLTAVRHANVGDVGAADVIAHRTFLVIIGAQPVAFGLEEREFMSGKLRNKLNTD